MSTTKKRISIYDYPEHLNPFSENHITFPDQRKIMVDKFRKNGTWSSKITKRLNRSVSWVEKSWHLIPNRFGVDDSPRRTIESKISNDLKNNSLYMKQSETHNLTRRESCSDIRNEIDSTTQQKLQINGNRIEKSYSMENVNKFETRKRKKRPAPAPPRIENSILENEKAEIGNEISEIYVEDESIKPQKISLAENILESKEQELVDETNKEDKTTQIISNEQLPSDIHEPELDTELQNLNIINDEISNSTKSVESVENYKECDTEVEEICKEKQIDENANITSLKIQCDGKPKVSPEKEL